jgi:D-3-phosphoglycerate dehydrogenase
MVDMSAMNKYGVSFGWTGGVNKRSVSEMVISLIVVMLRHLAVAQRDVVAGHWQQRVGGLLSGRTVGVIGCGFVGKDLITLLKPWGCNFLAHDTLEFKDFYEEYQVKPVSLNYLLQQSDVISIHLPLDYSTRNLLNADKLRHLKSSCILINAARGGLVDELEVKRMLIEKRIAGAAFDVFLNEPPEDSELLQLGNFFATPHLGGSAEEAIFDMGMAAIEGLDKHNIPVVSENG